MKYIYLVVNGFLMGMLFEYNLRVKVDSLAISLGVLILIQTILKIKTLDNE
jgi:hypothetical protein